LNFVSRYAERVSPLFTKQNSLSTWKTLPHPKHIRKRVTSKKQKRRAGPFCAPDAASNATFAHTATEGRFIAHPALPLLPLRVKKERISDTESPCAENTSMQPRNRRGESEGRIQDPWAIGVHRAQMAALLFRSRKCLRPKKRRMVMIRSRVQKIKRTKSTFVAHFAEDSPRAFEDKEIFRGEGKLKFGQHINAEKGQSALGRGLHDTLS